MPYYIVNEDELYHYGISGMHWGIHRGPPYPLTARTVASSIHEHAKKRINRISSDVISSVKQTTGKMYGLEHKLKTEGSIERKINKELKEKNGGIEQAANSIKDAIRFSMISSESDFVKNYEIFKKLMKDKGYSEIRCKNYFIQFKEGKVKHKSVQSNFIDQDGYIFEVQFHTPSSQKVKNDKIPLYEEVRNINTSSTRRYEIEKQMELMAKNIRDPMGIDRIKSYN